MAANDTTAKMRDALVKIILGEGREGRSSDGDERLSTGRIRRRDADPALIRHPSCVRRDIVLIQIALSYLSL